jgi:hypothetical protein
VLTASSVALTHGVLVMVPRLHTRINQLQSAELLIAGLRVTLIGVACLIGINAIVAVFIAVLTLFIQNQIYRRWAAKDADLTAPENEEDREKIWKLVRQQAANGIYFCIQGPLTIFLIATLGNSQQVADLGALSRIGVILTVVSAVVINLVLPKVARIQDRRHLISFYKNVVLVSMSLSILFMLLGTLFPSPLLWILGSQYQGLRAELPYVLFASSASAVSGILNALNSARGWLKGIWLIIPITLVTQALLIPFLSLGSLQGAVLLTSLPMIPVSVFYLYRSLCEFRALAIEEGEIA